MTGDLRPVDQRNYLAAAAVVSVAVFGRGRGNGTLASVPAGIASGVAVSGSGAAWAEGSAKFRNDGLCTLAAPGMVRAKCCGWVTGGAKTSGGGAAAVCTAGAASGAGACKGNTAGLAAGTGLVANTTAAAVTGAC